MAIVGDEVRTEVRAADNLREQRCAEFTCPTFGALPGTDSRDDEHSGLGLYGEDILGRSRAGGVCTREVVERVIRDG